MSWITWIFPPAIWAVQMQLNYWFVRGACARGSSLALVMAATASVVIVGIEGFICWLAWRRLQQVWANEDVRERFMAMLGVLTAGMFLLVIIAQGLAPLFIGPCQT